MKYIIFIILTILTIEIAGQGKIVREHNPIILVPGYSIEGYHSFGFSNITNSVLPDLSSANPASIINYQSPAIGFKSEYSTNIKNTFLGLGYERANPAIPKSFCFVYPISELAFGVAYNQKYSSSIDYSKVKIHTFQNPEGKTLDAKNKTIIHNFSLISAFSINGLFSNGPELVLGIQLNFDYLKNNEDYLTMTTTRSGNAFSFNAGTILKLSESFSFGVVYQSKTEISGDGEIKNTDPMMTGIDPNVRSNWLYELNEEITFKTELPSKVSFGAAYLVSKKITTSATVSIEFWNEYSDNIKDNIVFSGGGIYQCSNYLDLSLGFLYSDRKFVSNPFDLNFQVFYLNAGIKYEISNFDLILDVGDSHLISNESRKHTRFELGVGYQISN